MLVRNYDTVKENSGFVGDEFAEFILDNSQYTSYNHLRHSAENDHPFYKLTN